MTVWVDNMQARYRAMIMCHMIADNETELHTMAQAIGVARKWYQGDHYDICLAMRAKAVRLGAQEITWRQAGAMMRLRLWGLPMSPVDTAIERMIAHKKEFWKIKFNAEYGKLGNADTSK